MDPTGRAGPREVDASVEKGEIVGVYGLRGSGTELVAEGLAGLHPEIGGELVLDGHVGKVMATPLAARRAGIAYVPAERKRDGLSCSFRSVPI